MFGGIRYISGYGYIIYRRCRSRVGLSTLWWLSRRSLDEEVKGTNRQALVGLGTTRNTRKDQESLARPDSMALNPNRYSSGNELVWLCYIKPASS